MKFRKKMKSISKLKTIALSLMMAAFLSIPTISNAQDRGLFGLGKSSADDEFNNRGDNDFSITVENQSFGQTVPIGSGIIILLGVSLSYIALKKKEDE